MDREAHAIGDVLTAAGSLLDPEALARMTVEHIRDVAGTHGSALYWWDDEWRALTPLALVDRGREEPDPHVHAGQGIIGEVFRSGRELVVTDYRAQVEQPVEWVRTGAAAAVPLIANGRTCGVLLAH